MATCPRVSEHTTEGHSMKASHLALDPGLEIRDIRYTCEYPFQRVRP